MSLYALKSEEIIFYPCESGQPYRTAIVLGQNPLANNPPANNP